MYDVIFIVAQKNISPYVLSFSSREEKKSVKNTRNSIISYSIQSGFFGKVSKWPCFRETWHTDALPTFKLLHTKIA